MTLTEIIIAAFAACIAAIVGLFKLWRNADNRRRAETRRANTHEEMRDNEREASQLDDTSLADRISRKP